MRYRDKVAVVTGAGSGIGRELALELARGGARVVITDLAQDRIDHVVGEIETLGGGGRGYLVDHADSSQVSDFARRFFSDYDRVDILCLNAGVALGGRIEEYELADWEWVVGNNLWSAVYMVHHFVPRMILQGRGQILITASGAGLIGIPGQVPYCTTKFALMGLGEALRIELAKYHITVTVLCPGVTKTRIMQDGRIYLRDQSGESPQPVLVDMARRIGANPARVAKKGLRALSRGKGVQLVPFRSRLLWLCKWISPSLYQRIARLLWETNWYLRV